MKKLILIVLICAILVPSISAETLGDLKVRFRYRVDEVDTAKAFFTDSSLTHWLNMSQEAVVQLGKFIPKTTKLPLGTSRVFTLPSGFRSVKQIFGMSPYTMVPYPIYPNPGFMAEEVKMYFSVVWINPDSANLIIKVGAAEDPDDTLYVEYMSTANVLTTDTSTVEAPANLTHLIIKEAIGHYYEAMHMRGQAQSIWQEVRMDMGLLQPGATGQ